MAKPKRRFYYEANQKGAYINFWYLDCEPVAMLKKIEGLEYVLENIPSDNRGVAYVSPLYDWEEVLKEVMALAEKFQCAGRTK